ncbi:unnamed protein product, partial [Meganyctiphanes norvegica]
MMTAGYPEQSSGPTSAAPPSNVVAAAAQMAQPQTPQPQGSGHSGGHPASVGGHDATLAGQPLPPDHHTYHHDQAQFEADKRSVYKHPLFPLLALLFEKCELATQSDGSVSSDSFNLDIQAFVQHQERDRKPFLMNDPEVDGLMIKAIQVLRIHLLELEKVQELCKDFCNRYITCLKGKMQSENLLRTEYGYDSPGSPDGGSPYNGHHQTHHMPHPHAQVVSTTGQILAADQHDGQQQQAAAHGLQVTKQQQQRRLQQQPCPQQQLLQQQQEQAMYEHHHQQQATPSRSPISSTPDTTVTTTSITTSTTTSSSQSSSTATSASNTTTSSTLSESSSEPLIQGSTPLSKIAANPCPPPPPTSLFNLLALSPASCEMRTRAAAAKHATAIMKSWLFQHIVHPYPSEDEKRTIASQTNLTLLQVNNWFINARRRILQPMIDASTPADQKHRKTKPYNPKAAATRFWPDNLI